MRKIILICFMSISYFANADINNDLKSYFDGLGFEGNATKARAWQGQAAGYATGGSLYLRTSSKSVQLLSMQVPSLTAGCGGIDTFLGSFSYISTDQFERLVKQIMANGAGYALDLALQTTVPEMKQAKDFLQKLAADVNSMNMNSCQAAQGIIGGLWPRTQESSQKVCQDIAGTQGIFADWAASRQGCTVGGQQNKVNSRADDLQRDSIITNKNLTWDALSSNAMLNGDRELKEFMMTITGSIIFNNSGQVTPLLPRASHANLIRAMKMGGETDLYVCDEPNLCLNPTVKKVNISINASLSERVKLMILSIESKVRGDFPLTNSEKGFLESTQIPILHYITNPLALGLNNNVLLSLSDYIAMDILIQYLQELIYQTQLSIGSRNYPEPALESLKNNLLIANGQLRDLQTDMQLKHTGLAEIDRQMQYLQQQVSGKLLSHWQINANFNGN